MVLKAITSWHFHAYLFQKISGTRLKNDSPSGSVKAINFFSLKKNEIKHQKFTKIYVQSHLKLFFNHNLFENKFIGSTRDHNVPKQLNKVLFLKSFLIFYFIFFNTKNYHNVVWYFILFFLLFFFIFCVILFGFVV